MTSDSLTKMEESIVRFAVRRYDRPFYRWGRYLGWLAVPLMVLNFVPAMKAHTFWINRGGIACLIFGYSTLVTRIIGKLAARLNPDGAETFRNPPNEHGSGTVRGMLVLLAAFFWVAIAVALDDPSRPRHPGLFLVYACECEIVIGIVGGLVVMMAGYAAYFIWRRRSLGTLWFRVGFFVAVLNFLAAITCGHAMLHLLNQYGYDQDSNRIWKANTVTTGLDEFYTYDQLNRLSKMQRGTLNSGKTGISGTPVREMDYTLDPTGNWPAYVTLTSGTTDLSQTRTSNKVNEITAIGGTPTWAAPAYDAAGNMTTMPQVATPTSSFTALYDAWNRMVKQTHGVKPIHLTVADTRGQTHTLDSGQTHGVKPIHLTVCFFGRHTGSNPYT